MEGLETAPQAAIAERDPFRLALVDMQMPGMDGKALGEKIKADPALSGTILIMLTSVASEGRRPS